MCHRKPVYACMSWMVVEVGSGVTVMGVSECNTPLHTKKLRDKPHQGLKVGCNTQEAIRTRPCKSTSQQPFEDSTATMDRCPPLSHDVDQRNREILGAPVA